MKHHLTDNDVKNAKIKEVSSQSKYADGGDLYLLVTKSGKYWRYNYRFNEKHKTLSLGVYHDIKLKEVRKKHEAAREKVNEVGDPALQRKITKLSRKESSDNSFEYIGRV